MVELNHSLTFIQIKLIGKESGKLTYIAEWELSSQTYSVQMCALNTDERHYKAEKCAFVSSFDDNAILL